LPAYGQTVPGDAQGWSFSVTPYLWLPSVSGDLRFDNPLPGSGATSADVAVDAEDILSALNFALMLSAEARYGRVFAMTDFIYLNTGSDSSRITAVDFTQAGRDRVSAVVDSGSDASLSGAVWTLAGGATALQGSWGNLDVFGGFRLFAMSARVDVNLAADVSGPGPGQTFSRVGRLKSEDTLFDGIVGVRGRINLGSGFHIPYALDIGAGSSRLTWQAAGGVAYQTGWAGVTLGYRHLYYDTGSDGLLQSFAFSGPYLAVSFAF
jgi:hypothetical protein